MTKAIRKKAKLKLLDPDAGYGSRPPIDGWPEVEGELIAAVPALHGKLWYLMKLSRPLPPGFNPLHSNLPEKYDYMPMWYLLLSPSPAMPTVDVPPDFIGDCLVGQKIAPVLVSIGVEAGKLPRTITPDHVPSVFPGLCSGDLIGVSS